jgi:hypothetical protein
MTAAFDLITGRRIKNRDERIAIQTSAQFSAKAVDTAIQPDPPQRWLLVSPV